MGLLSLCVSKKPCMDIKVCLKINSSYKVNLLGVIFLTTKLTIVAVHVNYLHMYPSNHSYFTVSRTGKTKQIHIWRPFQQVCVLSESLYPCYFIKKMLLKMWFRKNSGTIYLLMSVCTTFPAQCKMVLRNAVWCNIPWNMCWHTAPSCILHTWISYLFLCF
jgi:hypothetical protein